MYSEFFSESVREYCLQKRSKELKLLSLKLLALSYEIFLTAHVSFPDCIF